MLCARLIRRHSSSIRTAEETRRAFVSFFEAEGHQHVPSSSVISPKEDQSLLFTNAGMNQFKGMLAGVDAPDRWPSRVVTHQKCIRAGGKHNDLDDVGKDLHHLSFFEMLGNWAFHNAYGKETACRLAWTFLTEIIQIPKDRLYVAYFGGHREWGIEEDIETREIWKKIGVAPEAILPFTSENFWEMGRTGSCGPCTEIHFDRVEGRTRVPHLVNRDDSVVELWNVVFTNSMRHDDGSVSRLPTMHVDTGLGLERLVSVVQGVGSNFDTDLFRPILAAIEKLTPGGGTAYTGRVGASDADGRDTAFRVIADHTRAACVALADGAVPSGSDAGFVVRRMVRKAAWRARQLRIEQGALADVVDVITQTLSSAYPELSERRSHVKAVIASEETKFWKTVEKGFRHFTKETASLASGDIISGPSLFRLHDAHGISADIAELWAEPRGLRLDLDAYERMRTRAREHSREQDVKKTGVRREKA